MFQEDKLLVEEIARRVAKEEIAKIQPPGTEEQPALETPPAAEEPEVA